MAEVFEDEQEKSAATAEIEHAFRRRAMQAQVLHPFPIQTQPRLDVRVFGVTRGGCRISLLDFPSAFLVDLRHHRRERLAKNGPLHPAPAAPVCQRLRKLENLTRKLHSILFKPEPKML